MGDYLDGKSCPCGKGETAVEHVLSCIESELVITVLWLIYYALCHVILMGLANK